MIQQCMSYRNHDLHVLKKEWIELPTMTIKCQFWNIDVISDDNDLLALKLDEIYNKVVVARVKVSFLFRLVYPSIGQINIEIY